MKPSIVIIGAKGNMGKAFTELFRSHGMKVAEVTRDMESTKKERAVKKADIIVFSVPIGVTPSVIKALAPHAKKGSLLCDITSIKGPALKALKKHAPSHSEILGLHPMFGPDGVKSLSSQIIAVCSIKPGTWSRFLLKFLKGKGALLKETTAQKHDELMAFIQGLVHLSSIAMGIAMEKLHLNLKETLAFSSPIYRLRLDMVGRILHQDPKLYGEIAMENFLTKKTMKVYLKVIETMIKELETKNLSQFCQNFSQAARYLGSFNEQAYQRTSKLIHLSKQIL